MSFCRAREGRARAAAVVCRFELLPRASFGSEGRN